MLLKTILPLVVGQRSNCYRSSITRFSRDIYSRLYPNFLVLPDGSTIRIRYSEPRHLVKVRFIDQDLCGVYLIVISLKFFQLPVDIASLSEKEQKTRLLRRSAVQKEKMEITLDTTYDPSAYLNKYTKQISQFVFFV